MGSIVTGISAYSEGRVAPAPQLSVDVLTAGFVSPGSIFATAPSRTTAPTLTRRTSGGGWPGCSNGGLPYKLPRLAGIRQERLEIRDGPGETSAQLNLRRPMQEFRGAGNIWAPLPWVILGQRSKLQFRSRADQ